MRFSKLPLLLTFLLATSCIPAMQDRNLKSSGDYSTNDGTSIVIIGVKTNWRLQAFRGDNKNDGWKQDRRATASFNTSPSNGYIVYKMKPNAPGQSYGIARFIDSSGDITLMCKKDQILTFNVRPNSVTYYGDIHITDTGDGLAIKLTSEYDHAKSYVAKHHSKIKDRLTKGSLKVQPSLWGECGVSHSIITGLVQELMADEPVIDDQQGEK